MKMVGCVTASCVDEDLARGGYFLGMRCEQGDDPPDLFVNGSILAWSKLGLL